jgi:pyridoxamine 5'-phosphate oxidase
MKTDLASLRAAYSRAHLWEEEAGSEPFRLFGQWFEEAAEAGVPEPNACTLATMSLDGGPTARVVLLKGFDERGFVFYTNYESRKGRELARNPLAAIVFWWPEVERQVRIEGTTERVPADESETYFRERPRDSQLGAWASAQSEPVASREDLARSLRAAEERFDGSPVPRPSHWGGYRLKPSLFEFWQGRPSRLHDRLEYAAEAGAGWRVRRLAP